MTAAAARAEADEDPVLRKLELCLRMFDAKHLEGLTVEELELCEGVVHAAIGLRDGLPEVRAQISALADKTAGLSRDPRSRIKRRKHDR